MGRLHWWGTVFCLLFADSKLFLIQLSSALGDIEGITCKMVYPTLMPFSFPSCQSSVLETVVVPLIGVTITKLQAHSLFISLFASIIAPFGGFFASGIKRAIKIKVRVSPSRTLPIWFQAMVVFPTAWIAKSSWAPSPTSISMPLS